MQAHDHSVSSRIARRLFLFLLLPLALAGCGEAPQTPPEITPSVSVVTIGAEPLTLTRELTGRTRAYLIAEVRPQVTGIVQQRLFTEGSVVKAGTPLYQLDDATYRAAYNSAKASLARADASAEIARLNAARAERLIKENAVSRQEFDSLIAARNAAEADVNLAKAQLASAQVRLGYATIRAPIAGITGMSSVTQGALVTADQAALLTTVQQLDPMYVDVTQSSSELLALRRELSGDALRAAEKIPVSIVLEDGSQFVHQGELLFSDVAVDPTTGSVTMRVLVPNPEQTLLPGMYVRAVVSRAVIDDALLVPQRAVSRNARGEAVAMLVTAENTVEQRLLEVGQAVGSQWRVKSGLAVGDRVVVAGLQKIRPGVTVQVAPADNPTQ